MRDGFVCMDMEGNIIECNAAFREMLGYDEEEGLKFEADTDELSDLVSWIRRFHSKRNIPFVFDGAAVFSCMLAAPTPGKANPEDPKFEAAGLDRCKRSDFVWELRD